MPVEHAGRCRGDIFIEASSSACRRHPRVRSGASPRATQRRLLEEVLLAPPVPASGGYTTPRARGVRLRVTTTLSRAWTTQLGMILDANAAGDSARFCR